MANTFLNSSNIKVFPSAFRKKSVDKESFLTTEGNFVNLGNKITNQITKYVYEVDGNLHIVLDGYLFVAAKNLFPSSGDVWVGINVSTYSGVKTLTPLTGSAGDVLDDDSTNKFIGLAYASSESALENCTTKLQILSNGTIYKPSTTNIKTSQIKNDDGAELLSIDNRFITKDLVVQGNNSKFEVNDAGDSITTSYNTLLVDSNDKPFKKSLLKSTDANATALNSSTLTYVDTVHQNSDGSVVETRKNAVFATGTNQGQFKIGTQNIDIKDLTSTSSPTFKKLTLSENELNGVSITSDATNGFTFTSQGGSLNVNPSKVVDFNANAIIGASFTTTGSNSITIQAGKDSTLALNGNLMLPASVTSNGTYALIQTKSGSTITPGWLECTSSNSDVAGKIVLRDSNNKVVGDITGNAATADEFKEVKTVQLTGDVTGSASSKAGWSVATTISNGVVTNAKLANGTIENDKIKDGTIANDKLVNKSITIGTTSVALGSSSTSLSGLTSLAGTSLAINCASVTATGAVKGNQIWATSDERLKKNIKKYHCDKSILDLDVKEFDFINDDSHHIGCIAQDLREICPEIVHEDESGYLSIEETKIVYLLLDEVKKLKKELEELRGK